MTLTAMVIASISCSLLLGEAYGLGSRFEEHGAWAFVLTRSPGKWRIIAYGWGTTDETEGL